MRSGNRTNASTSSTSVSWEATARFRGPSAAPRRAFARPRLDPLPPHPCSESCSESGCCIVAIGSGPDMALRWVRPVRFFGWSTCGKDACLPCASCRKFVGTVFSGRWLSWFRAPRLHRRGRGFESLTSRSPFVSLPHRSATHFQVDAGNIGNGRPGATEAQIVAAAKAANAHDFMMGFPDGYDCEFNPRYLAGVMSRFWMHERWAYRLSLLPAAVRRFPAISAPLMRA